MRILSLRVFIQTTLSLTEFDVLFALNLVLSLLNRMFTYFPTKETDILLLLIALISCISLTQYLRHNLGYKQKIQVVRRNQVYFSSSNVSTDTTAIVKD